MKIENGKIECLPKETGYDASRIDALNKHFESLVKKEIIYGAQYTITHKGKIIANASLGGNSKFTPKPIMPDTGFRIFSITKIFTAVAIMKLVEDGKIRLDTKVSEIIPQFACAPFSTITLWNLLTHTSGIYPDGGCYPDKFPLEWFDLIDIAGKAWNKKGTFDWITTTLQHGIKKPVGSAWMYASVGFVYLGEVISRVSGMNVHKYIEENILKPLNMTESGFTLNKKQIDNLFCREEFEMQMAKEMLKPESKQDLVWSKIPRTGGGLYSTTLDLVKFGNMLLRNGNLNGNRIIGRKSIEKMTTIQLHNIPDDCWGGNDPDRQYGIGFDMRNRLATSYSEGSFFHEGYGACCLSMDPKEDLCAAWYVPWNKVEWCADGLYNAQNVIWSGII